MKTHKGEFNVYIFKFVEVHEFGNHIGVDAQSNKQYMLYFYFIFKVYVSFGCLCVCGVVVLL